MRPASVPEASHLFVRDRLCRDSFGENWFCAQVVAQQPRPFPLPGARPHYARDRVADVQHMSLELAFDLPDRKLFGRATTRFTALNNGVNYLDLDAAELTIQQVTDEDGRALRYETFDHTLRLHFPEPLREGQESTVTVTYWAQPRRGLYFTQPDEAYPRRPTQIWTQGEDEDSRYWFPCYDFPNEKATTEIRATVPRTWIAVSNGRLVSVQEDPTRATKTFHWRQEQPHSIYLVSLVAGEFAELRDKLDGIDVTYYVPPGREEEARRSFSRTPDMLRFFSERLGVPYPYPKYAQVAVADFIYGGMENTSATTLTDITLHDERAHLDFESEPLVAHELAHQWFGDLLTCRDWSHGWLNEGFATYFEDLYKEHWKGRDEFLYGVYDMLELYFKEDRERYRRPIVSHIYIDPSELFDRHLYEKAGLVLHMIRYLLGDELWWKSIRHYTRKFQQQNVETTDFRKAIEEVTGRNLEAFFDEWFYHGGHPDFKVSYTWDEDRKTVALTVEQMQTTDALTPIFHLPLDVSFRYEDGEDRHRIQITDKQQTFQLRAKQRPRAVRFDPDNWILKTLDFPKSKEELLYQLQQDPSVIERIRAAEGLAKLGTVDAVAALRTAVLQDPFWGVQAEAAKALGKIRSTAALEALQACVTVAHPKARRAVVRALGEFHEERAADTLLPVLTRDASYFVEADAATSLGKTRSTRAFEALKQALSKESFNEVIRSGIFDGFAELHDERAIPIARDWTAYGKPQRAREAAARCLGKLGEGKREVREHLTRLLTDPIFQMRRAVVQALTDLDDPDAIPEMEDAIDREHDARIRRLLREGIRKLKESRERPQELKQLRDDFERLREANRQLRDRLDRLEERLKPTEPPT